MSNKKCNTYRITESDRRFYLEINLMTSHTSLVGVICSLVEGGSKLMVTNHTIIYRRKRNLESTYRMSTISHFMVT
jgi:hypothetical protein